MKSILNNPIIYLYKKMYIYAGNQKRKIFQYNALFVIANSIEALQPLVFGYFLDLVQKESVTRENLLALLMTLILFLLTEFLTWAFWGPARVMEQKIAFNVKKNYKEYLLRGTMALPMSWHADHHSGDTIDKIEKGSNAIFAFSENTFVILMACIRLLISFGALFYFNANSSFVIVGLTFFAFYIVFLFDKKLVPGYKIVNNFENKTSAKVFDVLSNITTVIILRVETLILKSISKAIDKPYEQFKENIINNELKWFWAGVFGQLSIIISIGIYIFSSVKNGEVVLIGSIYIIYTYASRIKETFFNFAYLYNDTMKWRSNVLNSEELSKEFSDVRSFKQKYLPDNWQDISIKNLSFSYHGKDNKNLHLDDINLSFKKGAKIAVIGESGGGKTTFLKLLRGLYEPQKMTLEINGKKSNKDFNDISESISLIPQDPEIFSTTIRENITLGVDYSDREIKKYTDMASFSDVVKRLPNKLESNIVEKGVNLSGGEKQRLALARGLLASKEKEIVLLDEPTSSVDFHNELKIYENIFSSFPKKTVISSIHRLHLLSLFDEIFFFKNGRIIAHGDLKYLQENSPDFVSLWEKYLKTQENT